MRESDLKLSFLSHFLRMNTAKVMARLLQGSADAHTLKVWVNYSHCVANFLRYTSAKNDTSEKFNVNMLV